MLLILLLLLFLFDACCYGARTAGPDFTDVRCLGLFEVRAAGSPSKRSPPGATRAPAPPRARRTAPASRGGKAAKGEGATAVTLIASQIIDALCDCLCVPFCALLLLRSAGCWLLVESVWFPFFPCLGAAWRLGWVLTFESACALFTRTGEITRARPLLSGPREILRGARGSKLKAQVKLPSSLYSHPHHP